MRNRTVEVLCDWNGCRNRVTDEATMARFWVTRTGPGQPLPTLVGDFCADHDAKARAALISVGMYDPTATEPEPAP